MGAKDFTELIAWQRADELRQFIHNITEEGPVSRDFKFRGQIRDAADGGPRNIAEGFGRYRHKEFAHFVSIAIGCIDEVKDGLRAGHLRRFFPNDVCETGHAMARRARNAMTGLLRYLRRTDAPGPPDNS